MLFALINGLPKALMLTGLLKNNKKTEFAAINFENSYKKDNFARIMYFNARRYLPTRGRCVDFLQYLCTY
jgi:hypothetical protein